MSEIKIFFKLIHQWLVLIQENFQCFHYRCFLKLYKVEIALANLINLNFVSTSSCTSFKSHRVAQHYLIEKKVLMNEATYKFKTKLLLIEDVAVDYLHWNLIREHTKQQTAAVINVPRHSPSNQQRLGCFESVPEQPSKLSISWVRVSINKTQIMFKYRLNLIKPYVLAKLWSSLTVSTAISSAGID